MSDTAPVVVVVMKPGMAAQKRAAVLRWLRWLLPAALLLVSPTPIEVPDADDVITLNADAIESGPLAVADAIVKAHEGG